jgi:hypothetical protein
VKIFRICLEVLTVALIVIQFFRPERNVSGTQSPSMMSNQIAMTDEIRMILQLACLDCHSNNTRCPWYAEIQPVGWWLAGHIREGRKELNFDDFGSYRPRRKFSKLRQIEEQITEGEMPLPSYTIIHKDAILSNEKKELLIAWTKELRDSLSARYPPDSLQVRRPR